MKFPFRVYIDESGDEGFVFKEDGSGSSRWLVLTALVIRGENELSLVQCLKDVRTLLGKKPNQQLHFSELKHEQRVAYVRKLAALKVRHCSVLVFKPAVYEPEAYQNQAGRLYHYATRYLLERVSWLCRDARRHETNAGPAEIIFSNRSNTSYADLRNYLEYLKAQSGPLEVSIDWNSIDPANVRSVDHAKMAGLQAVDAVASSVFFAARLNRFGDSEPRYAEILMPLAYKHQGKCRGYGIKFWPELSEETKKANPHLSGFAL